MMADAPTDGAELAALLAEAKVLVAEIRAWGHVSAKDCALLFGDLITALEAAREDKADWEQLLKATDAELDDMRDVANEADHTMIFDTEAPTKCMCDRCDCEMIDA
jgi:hypothetical protein